MPLISASTACDGILLRLVDKLRIFGTFLRLTVVMPRFKIRRDFCPAVAILFKSAAEDFAFYGYFFYLADVRAAAELQLFGEVADLPVMFVPSEAGLRIMVGLKDGILW